jgi:hypothetical protein
MEAVGSKKGLKKCVYSVSAASIRAYWKEFHGRSPLVVVLWAGYFPRMIADNAPM